MASQADPVVELLWGMKKRVDWLCFFCKMGHSHWLVVMGNGTSVSSRGIV